MKKLFTILMTHESTRESTHEIFLQLIDYFHTIELDQDYYTFDFFGMTSKVNQWILSINSLSATLSKPSKKIILHLREVQPRDFGVKTFIFDVLPYSTKWYSKMTKSELRIVCSPNEPVCAGFYSGLSFFGLSLNGEEFEVTSRIHNVVLYHVNPQENISLVSLIRVFNCKVLRRRLASDGAMYIQFGQQDNTINGLPSGKWVSVSKKFIDEHFVTAN